MSFQIVNPSTGAIVEEGSYDPKEAALVAVSNANAAFSSWSKIPLATKIALLEKLVSIFTAKTDLISTHLASVIGRPYKQSKNEVNGFKDRAEYLLDIARDSLNDYLLPQKDNFNRFVRRVPLGLIFVIAPWNYPYLCMVNSVFPALLAGNTVIVKQSPQTFKCAEILADCFVEAGFPPFVFQALKIDHQTSEDVIKHPDVKFVQFTGSVNGGRQVQRVVASSDKFIGSGFELGGKDPAYVREDADIDYAAENIVDGAMYNSGQSCCAVERVYVHESVYDRFVAKCVEVVKGYVLGNPLDPETNLGPVISKSAADYVRDQVKDAVSKGAITLIDESLYPIATSSSAYVTPQILVNVNHTMKVMKQETFGPLLPIYKVSSDQEAITLMNDSDFGLTCSIWTESEQSALEIGDLLETGTVFMNRADCLDPGLPWVGVKDSGRGVSLSRFGFDALTRPKSFHLRVKI